MKYLMKWKGYTAKENTWEGIENLKNAMEKVDEFEKGRFKEEIQRIKIKKRKEMKLNPEAEKFKRGKLPGRYIVKLLYGWDDKKFDKEYLKKLERNWNRWKNEKKEISLRQLFVSTIELLTLSLCLKVSFSRERQCGFKAFQ